MSEPSSRSNSETAQQQLPDSVPPSSNVQEDIATNSKFSVSTGTDTNSVSAVHRTAEPTSMSSYLTPSNVSSDESGLLAATYLPGNANDFMFDTLRITDDSTIPSDTRQVLTPEEIKDRRITRTEGEIRHALALELPEQPELSTDLPSGRRRHNNQDVLKALLKIVEGGTKPLHSEKVAPGKLVVDQSLPVPRLFEVRKKVFRVSETGESELPPAELIRSQAVFEILETEQAYVESLDVIMELLISPLRKQNDADVTIIEEEDIQIIFSNIETMRGVNCVFLKRLEDRLSSWHDTQYLGDIFIEMAPFFKTYCAYVDNYPRAMARARVLREQNQLFAEFLNQFQINPRVKKLDIFSYLIKPIQRIPRYVLLAEAVIKHTRPDHPDYGHLQKGMALFKSVADYVNTKAAENENRAKVWEIQNRFMRIGSQNIVEPARRFLREGILHKLSLTDNSLQRRISYLFSDMLLTAMPIGAFQKQDKLMPLLTAAVLDCDVNGPYPHMFWFVSPVKTIQFVTNTKEEKITWLDDINSAISNLIAANPHLAVERSKYEILTDDAGTPFMNTIGGPLPADAVGNQAGQNPRLRSKPLVKFKNLLANTVEGFMDLVTRQSSKPAVAAHQTPQPNAPQQGASPGSPRQMAQSTASSSTSTPMNLSSTTPRPTPEVIMEDEDEGFYQLNEPKPGMESDPELAKNMVKNKGMVRLEHEDVRECSGHIMWSEDKRHEKTYPIDSTYIVFPESYYNMFYRDIGTLILENLGEEPLLLVSHQRKSEGDRMTYYKFQGHRTELFDYRGCWCVEVRQGDCARLRVVEVKNAGGTGHFNNLNMM